MRSLAHSGVVGRGVGRTAEEHRVEPIPCQQPRSVSAGLETGRGEIGHAPSHEIQHCRPGRRRRPAGSGGHAHAGSFAGGLCSRNGGGGGWSRVGGEGSRTGTIHGRGSEKVEGGQRTRSGRVKKRREQRRAETAGQLPSWWPSQSAVARYGGRGVRRARRDAVGTAVLCGGVQQVGKCWSGEGGAERAASRSEHTRRRGGGAFCTALLHSSRDAVRRRTVM